LLAEATASGVLEKKEHDIVSRLFRLSDLTVSALMTPREQLVWLDLAAASRERLAEAVQGGHTRFLACLGALDHVRGYVKVQDLLVQALAGGPPDPSAVLRQPHRVRPWTPAFRVLERFQRTGDHIAIVTGHGGRLEGLVTLNDILEKIVGEFPEPHEMSAPGAVRRADGSWLMDGLLSWQEAMRILGHESEGGPVHRTLHAFVVHHLGEDPSAADVFTWDGLRVEVVDMDGSRVDKVLVAPVFEEDGVG
jgi:putative hemolysin